MTTRRTASSDASAAGDARIVVVRADGVAGADGAHGAHAWGGHGDGADGGPGGAAGPSAPGTHASHAEVTLISRASSSSLPADGLIIKSAVDDVRAADAALRFAGFGSVDVSAVGGRGGAGGVGGNGGDGSRGRSGTDATRYSNGGDGGPGGDGGDGGRGSDGARGGDGNVVRVVVDERDAYLLMAVEEAEAPEKRVRGGSGGVAGAHGHGGNGGRGGPGGSSHSWTETVTDTGTDSNGNLTTSTRTIWHTNHGGSEGPSGTSGRTPTALLRAGPDGAPGRFEIVVGERVYARRYDLALTSFGLVETDPATHDGVLEPGEVVAASQLRFQNVGRMPTPKHQRIRVTLARGALLVDPLGDEGFLERSLEANDTGRVEGPLRFRIRDQIVDAPADPLVLAEEVAPIAEQLGTEIADTPAADAHFVRRYDGVTLTRTVVTRFPICNHGDIRALRSLAPGERSRIVFDVHNVSMKDLGRASAGGRVVAVHLTWEGGEIPPGDVSFHDADGAQHDFALTGGDGVARAGYFAEIPLLKAGARVDVSGVIGVARHAAAYGAARFRYTLLLERLPGHGVPGELRVVQMRELTLRVEPGYHREDDTRVLLVTNDATRQEMHRAWHRFLEEDLGLPTDDWSLTRYGHLDMRAPLDDGTDLYTHLEDKLVVILNDPFHPRSEPVEEAPASYVRSVDFRLGATRNGTHLLATGNAPFDVAQLLAPVGDERHGGDDIDEVAQLYAKEQKSAGALAEEVFKDDVTRTWDVVTVKKTCAPFFRPKPDALATSTRAIEARLRALSPEKRHVLVMRPHEAPRPVGRFLGIFPRFELGAVEVRRTLDRDAASAVVLSVDGTSIAEDGAGARACRFAALLALPFADKITVLERFLRRTGPVLPGDTPGPDADRVVEETGPLLVDAILAEVAREIRAALLRTSLDDEAAIESALPALLLLTRFALPGVDEHTPSGRMMLSLCAGLRALAQSRAAWWRIAGKRARLARFVDERTAVFTGLAFGAGALLEQGQIGASPASALLARAIEGHHRAARDVADRDHVDASDAMLEVLAHPERAAGARAPRVAAVIARDTDALLEPSSRIWSVADLERHRAAEEQRLSAQRELREKNGADRAAMIVAAPRLEAGAPAARVDETAQAAARQHAAVIRS